MDRGPIDALHAILFGDLIVDLDLDAREPAPSDSPASIVIGIDRQGSIPDDADKRCDLLLTARADPPRPWIGVPGRGFDTELATLRVAAGRHPFAATALAQVLRAGAPLPVGDALVLESFAYSTLLGGSEFKAWIGAHPPTSAGPDSGRRLRLEREADTFSIWLSNPDRHNAIDAKMRDDLTEALRLAVLDPSVTAVRLLGDGRAFSVGGDVEEFGTTSDTATAHQIRCLHSPTRLLDTLRARTSAFLHGACIGSGIEIPAAAGRVIAAPGSWFQLPEVGMGLIPGAGGTVTIPRRIGRHRTLYWCLTGRKLNVRTACDWGLVDEIGVASP
jgi:enoyl-CoA hydratase/isomerase-like protein